MEKYFEFALNRADSIWKQGLESLFPMAWEWPDIQHVVFINISVHYIYINYINFN